MIFSKANFQAAQVASKDEFDQGLNGLRIEPDGTTVAGNASREGASMMAVSPAERGRARIPDVGEEASVGDSGVVLDLSLVDDVVKNMPKNSKRPEMQYAVMTRHQRDGRRCEFTTYDMRKEKRVSDLPKTARYPDWRAVLRKVAAGPMDEYGEDVAARVCVNRRHLIDLLKALESSCPDKGDYNPVWIELGRDGSGMMLRCVNWMTNQRAIGFLQAFQSREGWLKWSEWERSLWGVVEKVKRKLKRVR